MKRNKYINTFDTTAEYDNYIESAAAGFPNVALTKDNDKVNYMSTSPNSHTIFGELVDQNHTIYLKNNINSLYMALTMTNDPLNNTFYYDGTVSLTNFTTYGWSRWGSDTDVNDGSNIKSIRKLDFTISNFNGRLDSFFQACSNLEYIDLSSFDNIIDDVTSTTSMFFNCSSLTDVYITSEKVLNKFTNNLSSQGNNYIPSNNGNCTIHYNGTDYKWQNNAWTPQS